MKNKLLLTCFLLLAGEPILFAQQAGDTTLAKKLNTIKRERYGVKQFLNETKLFITLPGTWKREDWFKVGFLGAGTYLLMQADQPLRNLVLSSDRKFYYSPPIVAGRLYGEWYTATALATGFTAYRLITLHSTTETKKINLELVQSVLYASTITEILKLTVGRERPLGNQGPFNFHTLNPFDDTYHSFPSGHTTLAFAISTVLARNTNSVPLKILAYVPATLTVASRIYQDKHWVSDILTGAAVGYFTSTWVVNLHEPKKKQVPAPENFNPLPSTPKTPLVDKPEAKPDRLTHIGLYGDLNTCKMWVSNNKYEIVRVGYSIGPFAKIAFSNYFSIEPELLFSTKGAKQNYDNEFEKGTVTFNLQYIDLPVLAVLNLSKGTNIHGGVYFSKLISSKTVNGASDETSLSFSQKASFEPVDYGLILGLGANTTRVNYGIRYNYGLGNIGKPFEFNGQTHRFPDGTFSIVQAYVSFNIY